MDSLEALKLFDQYEAALVTKADLRAAMVVVLSKIEHVLADAAG